MTQPSPINVDRLLIDLQTRLGKQIAELITTNLLLEQRIEWLETQVDEPPPVAPDL